MTCSATVTSGADAASSALQLPQYSFDLAADAPSVDGGAGVASASGHPFAIGSDGSYYALVATSEGHQYVKLIDIGGDFAEGTKFHLVTQD